MKRIIATCSMLLALQCHAAIPSLKSILPKTPLTLADPSELEGIAQKGDSRAQLDLGIYYLQSPVTAVIETSDSDDSESTKKSATALRKSGRFEDSIRKGQYWVQQAAESGYPAAQAFLGICQIVELCTPGGAEEGLSWIRKAALGGFAEAQYLLGVAYLTGDGVSQDIWLGMLYIDEAAKQGHVEAKGVQELLEKKLNGHPAKTETDYVREAEAGSAEAKFNLAEKYAFGANLPQNEESAVKWYLRAAQQGHIEAMLVLAKRYGTGVGALLDEASAVQWFKTASSISPSLVATRMTDIGRMYYGGAGIRADDSKAQQWFLRAAELNNVDALIELGWMYYTGRGVQKNYAVAAEWYEKSARLGDASSQYQLASMYERGLGLTANSEDAYFWWYLSTLQNYIGGELNSEGYWSKLTATQIQVLQKKARMWKPITP